MKSQPRRFHIHECPLTEAGCHDVPEPSCGDGNDDTEDICCSMSIPGIDMFSCSCCCAGVIETPEVACAADKAWQRSKDINTNKIDLTQTSCMQFGRKVFSDKRMLYRQFSVGWEIRCAMAKRVVGYRKALPS